MSGQQAMDTNCITLTRFILEEQRKTAPHATGDLTNLLVCLQTACKAVSSAVRKAGISKLYGMAGDVNVQGEEVKKLDVLANDLFINMLSSSYTTCLMVSEENSSVIEVEKDHQGKYVVCFDPLDGSSNIDCLVSIGSIFSIYRKEHDKEPSISDALLPGNKLVAAGYALYGSATMLVLSTGQGVNGFMLDPGAGIGELIATQPPLVEKDHQGKKEHDKEPSISDALLPGNKLVAAGYALYGSATMLEFCYFIQLFIYPAANDTSKGKLRLLYECNPMAYIMEQAGGMATNGKIPILDVQPTEIHQRSPIYLGSTTDINEILDLYKKHNL
ncbi:unnamed protein product, partial [Meganyctiphanes norvegica]